MEVNEEEMTEEEQTSHLGIVNEISGYTAKIIIDKDEAPKPIYPIDTPMPIYVKDQNNNNFLIYEQNLISPASDLPSLNILSDSGVIVLDPAKHFILKSALSSFQASAVLITELGVPQLLSDVYKLTPEEIQKCWKDLGFNHLKLAAELLGVERFKIFMRVFTEMFLESVLENKEVQEALLTILVEIGDNKNMNDKPDYLSILESYATDDTVAIVLDNSMSEVKALVKDPNLKYGDLICFYAENRLTLTVIRELQSVAILDPLFAIEDGKPTTFVRPLTIGMEGTIKGVDEILSELNSSFDERYIKIPIAEIPQTEQIYNVILKGNELLHFAIIAISGKGKGNVLKELIFEHQCQIVQHLEDNGNLNNWNGLGMILFDDAGEYVKCLKPRDWGMNLGMLVLGFLNDERPRIHLVDISGRIEQNDDIEPEYRYVDVNVMKIPLEYIPLKEVLRKLEEKVAYGLVLAYLRYYYTQEETRDIRPAGFSESRLTLEFVNWFTNSPLPFNVGRGRDMLMFTADSYAVARREIMQFLLANQNYLGIRMIDAEQFRYITDQDDNEITQPVVNADGEEIRMTLHEDYNLLNLAMQCADQGATLIIDESSLNPNVKLLVQRIILNHIVETREQLGFNPNITPCLFIIEEATALIRGKASLQIELFLQMQVRARKFGVGMGLVLQDINKLDPSLLTQLGWMIALGLPVDSMRSVLFKNVPAELGSYDDYVKYADVGMAVGFQMLLGSNLPLPIKVRHYEKVVKDLLWSEEIWGEDGFDLNSQNHFREVAQSLDVPDEVIDEILIQEEDGD